VSTEPERSWLTLTAGERWFINQFEQKFGIWIGEQRYRLDQERRCTARVISEQDRLRANMRGGAMAEVAAARKLNLYPMLQFTEYLDYDLRLPGGDLIGVQWNMRPECIVDQRREADHRRRADEPPDFYLILTGQLPHFEFAGWVTHEEAIAAPIEDLSYGPCHIRRALHPELQILTLARGHGWRAGRETGSFDFVKS